MLNSGKKALMHFVEQLPTETNCSGYDEVVKKMAERYGAATQDLTMVLEQYHDFFRESTTMLLSERYSASGDVQFDDFTAILERVVKSVLLRMWVYGHEHSSRSVFPKMLDGFTSELDALLNQQKES